MNVQEFFYWTASIALILIGLFTIALFALIFYIKQLVDKTADKIIRRVDAMTEQVETAGRMWRNLSLTRFVIKTIKLIF